MKHKTTTQPDVQIRTTPPHFEPTQKQLEALAQRLVPEIKNFFSDAQVRQEFDDWIKKQSDES